MSLFDKIKKKKSEEAVTNAANPYDTSGWKAIEDEFLRIYPGQKDPKHYGTIVKWSLGGKDPLDGISIYDAGDYWHFVTFGLSEIYEKESENKEISGFGYEMTLKLKKQGLKDEEAEIRGICGILQTIARITFTKGEVFAPDEYLYTGQTAGIDVEQRSNLTGFICVSDPSVNEIDTPNGKVFFLEFIGMTDAELKTLSDKKSVQELYKQLGNDLTDYQRKSLI